MKYIVYTDGSFKDTPFGPYYAGAAAIIVGDDVRPSHLIAKVGNDAIVYMQNVAGEIIAAMSAFEYLLNVVKVKPEDSVEVRYDYAGIENWTKKKGEDNYWKAKNKTTQAYRDYVSSIVRQRCQLTFKHIKSHTGEPGNTLVDHVCKDAIDQQVARLQKEVR